MILPVQHVEKETHIETLSTASRRVPTRHIIEARPTHGVQHGIEETKGRLARGELRVVQEGDDASERWCGSRGAPD
jgi:hypothetical protein